MQDVLNIISILAFGMSLITWISAFFSHRLKLHIECKDFAKRYDVIQLFFYVQNNSDKPFTISGVSLISDVQKHSCEYLSKIIRTQGDTVVIRTPDFPISFAPHQGRCFALEFLHCPEIELIPGKTVSVEIYTNRKRLMKSLVLPQPDRILHLR